MFLLLISLISQAEQNVKLTHFTPGVYNLATGDEAKCRTGEFMIYEEEGTKVSLGAYHIFNVANGTEVVPDTNEKIKKCVYDVQDSYSNYADFSTIEFKSVYKCNGTTQFTMTRTAKIKKNSVTLNVNQVGTPIFKYACQWELSSRKIDSIKPTKTFKKK